MKKVLSLLIKGIYNYPFVIKKHKYLDFSNGLKKAFVLIQLIINSSSFAKIPIGK